MANRALGILREKARSETGYVVALGIGWVISFPIAIISAQNFQWGWFAFAVLLHAFCSSWFFFWFFYAQMSQLFYMNAAAVVEAIESKSFGPSGSQELSATVAAPLARTIPSGNPVDNFLRAERVKKSVIDGANKPRCETCNRLLLANGKCPSGC